MIIGSNQVMEKSNMTSRFDNSDHDGDSLIALALHSEEARNDFKYAFAKNLMEFEHMDELLIDYEHESIYASFMLTKMAEAGKGYSDIGENKELSLMDRTFTIEDFRDNPGSKSKYEVFGYLTNVEAAINQSLLKPLKELSGYIVDTPIYTIERDGQLSKKNLMRLTERVFRVIQSLNKTAGTELINFWDVIHEFDKFLLEC
jgi:hypothetical protein